VRPLSAARAPLVAHTSAGPRVPVVSIATADLRAELNCRRGEEDSCITIERQCERRHNVEGRNLKRDFDSLVTQEVPVARAVRPPSPPKDVGRVHGTRSSPPDGGLAMQVPATPAGEVRQDCQLHRVPIDLLHLHPHHRRGRGCHGQLFSGGFDRYSLILAHEPA
jgi:hypothetical protein